MAQKNRWHRVMLPDDYIMKMKQDQVEADAAADSSTRRRRAVVRPFDTSAVGLTSAARPVC